MSERQKTAICLAIVYFLLAFGGIHAYVAVVYGYKYYRGKQEVSQ